MLIPTAVGDRHFPSQEHPDVSPDRTSPPAKPTPEEAVKRVQQAGKFLKSELHKVIIGQEQMIEEMLICLFARGHCLTIGVPGLAKTLTVATLARALHMKFSRIQFTPDLMPSDITGTEIIEEDAATGKRTFRFVQGPDLRQRRPGRRDQPHPAENPGRPAPGHAGIPGHRRRQHLRAGAAVFRDGHPEPHRAGGNLPAARGPARPLHAVDQHRLPQPGGGAADRQGHDPDHAAARSSRCSARRDLLWIQQLVRQVPAGEHMVDYAVDLARATRPKEPNALPFIKNWLAWGAGPRAAQYIILAAKARAILHGRLAVGAEDLRAMATPRAAAPHLHQLQRRRRGR